jgi:hypothetical protein
MSVRCTVWNTDVLFICVVGGFTSVIGFDMHVLQIRICFYNGNHIRSHTAQPFIIFLVLIKIRHIEEFQIKVTDLNHLRMLYNVPDSLLYRSSFFAWKTYKILFEIHVKWGLLYWIFTNQVKFRYTPRPPPPYLIYWSSFCIFRDETLEQMGRRDFPCVWLLCSDNVKTGKCHKMWVYIPSFLRCWKKIAVSNTFRCKTYRHFLLRKKFWP